MRTFRLDVPAGREQNAAFRRVGGIGIAGKMNENMPSGKEN
jgi:hypothetical protein